MHDIMDFQAEFLITAARPILEQTTVEYINLLGNSHQVDHHLVLAHLMQGLGELWRIVAENDHLAICQHLFY